MRRIQRFTTIILILIMCLSGCKKQERLVSSAPQSTSARQSTSAPQSTSAEKEDTLSLCMVGDVLLHDRLEAAAKQADGSYNYDFLFSRLKGEIESKDIAIVNQEVIIGGKELGVSGYPAFNASFEMADALAGTGFDVVCHGTNHALDKGKKGILHALSNWKEEHPDIHVLGINDSKADQENICIIEKNNIKVAILNYTYGTNGIKLPDDMPYAVDLLDETRVRKDIKKAEEMADFTIVCPHWGTEYSLKIDEMQKKWTKIFRECGADLVIGTHPHVIEGIEKFDDKDPDTWSNNHGNGDMLVYYSLGNFANWTSNTGTTAANCMLGGMAEVVIKKTGSTGVAIDKFSMIPLVCHVSDNYEEISVYTLEGYTKDLEEKNAIRRQTSEFSIDYCRELWNNVIGGGLKNE